MPDSHLRIQGGRALCMCFIGQWQETNKIKKLRHEKAWDTSLSFFQASSNMVTAESVQPQGVLEVAENTSGL